MTPAFLDQHIVSHKIDVASLRNDNFDVFFLHRAKALLDLISVAMGKTISNRDSDEIILKFGGTL